MSKKIAQLTKVLSPPRTGSMRRPQRCLTLWHPQVIYHLNTRNDDHQYEVKQLKGSYEEEIGQVRQMATLKP